MLILTSQPKGDWSQTHDGLSLNSIDSFIDWHSDEVIIGKNYLSYWMNMSKLWFKNDN